jgi:mono/diheme cytochrome c family protein
MKKISVALALCTLAIVSASFYKQGFDVKASVKRGKAIYETQCMACHMAQGEGLPGAFPPLAKSDYLSDKNRLIKVVLQGVTGPMKVNGIEYNVAMAPVKLTDAQTADVLNYVLNAWGNKGVIVKPTDIKPALKAKVKNYQPNN